MARIGIFFSLKWLTYTKKIQRLAILLASLVEMFSLWKFVQWSIL